ncbi:MAG: hypothetical protein WCP28_06885 [Actinomycetes bacterium]
MLAKRGCAATDVRTDVAPSPYDTGGDSTGTAELRYVNVDAVVAQALQVPNEMRPGQKRETMISTNVENILLPGAPHEMWHEYMPAVLAATRILVNSATTGQPLPACAPAKKAWSALAAECF